MVDTAISDKPLPADPFLNSTNDEQPFDFLEPEDAVPFLTGVRRSTEEPAAPHLTDLPCEPLPASLDPKLTALGEPIASLRFGHQRYLNRWLIGSGCILAGIVFVLISYFRIAGVWPPLLAAIIFFGYGAFFIGSTFLAMRRSPAGTLWICPEGLIWQRRDSIAGCAWHEVVDFCVRKSHTQVKKPAFWESEELDAHVVVGMKRLAPRYSGQAHWNYHYVLICPEIEPFIFSSESAPAEVKAFGDRIQFETTRALLPHFRQRLHRGETLLFLPFHLNSQALLLGKEGIPWSELLAVATGNDLITIYAKDGKAWRKVPYGDISHASAFTALIDEQLQRQRRPAR